MKSFLRNTRYPIIFLFSLILSHSIYSKDSLDWMKIPKDISLQYDIQDVSDSNLGGLYYTSKKSRQSASYKILALLPKQSNSYSLAFSEFLQALSNADMPSSIWIKNFENNVPLGKKVLQKAVQEQYNLFFSMGSESAAFFHNNYRDGDIPVVTSINKDPVALGQIKDYEHGSGTNIAYTTLNVPINIQMSYIQRLKPNIENIGILYNRNHAQVTKTEVNPFKEFCDDLGINAIDVTVASSETARITLVGAVKNSIETMRVTDPNLENSIFWVTSSTAIFENMDIVNQYAENVPVIATNPNVVNKTDNSAVIGIGIDRRSNARLASKYAIDILNETVNPGNLKVGIVTPPDIAVNFKFAKKIALKIPFSFFENASFVYDYKGNLVREFGQKVTATR